MGNNEMTDQDGKDQDEGGKKRSLNPLQVIGSVFAAGLGVQSSKNRERDFKQGKFSVFIIAGVVFTLLLIGAVFAVVQLVLKNAAG
jgi:hypothetical protein